MLISVWFCWIKEHEKKGSWKPEQTDYLCLVERDQFRVLGLPVDPIDDHIGVRSDLLVEDRIVLLRVAAVVCAIKGLAILSPDVIQIIDFQAIHHMRIKGWSEKDKQKNQTMKMMKKRRRNCCPTN